MTSSRIPAFALAVIFATSACGPSASQIATVEATRNAEEFPIVPMQLVIARGRAGALVLAMDKDGTLRDGSKVVGTMKAGRVTAPRGEERISVAGDGRLRYTGGRTLLRFERDEIVSDNGKRISIDDDGKVVFAPPMKKKRAFAFRFEGFTPAARRTALVLLMLVVLDAERDEPSEE